MLAEIILIGDKHQLPNHWLNSDFVKTSWDFQLIEISKYYRTLSTILLHHVSILNHNLKKSVTPFSPSMTSLSMTRNLLHLTVNTVVELSANGYMPCMAYIKKAHYL